MRNNMLLSLSLGFVLSGCGANTPIAPRVASKMVGASAEVLEGVAGAPVLDAPAVIVEDQRGLPISGVRVIFTVVAGGGILDADIQTTNVAGRASPGGWILGAEPGENIVVASSVGLEPITFHATARPAPVLPPPTIPTAEILERSPFQLLLVNGAALPYPSSNGLVSAAVLTFKDGLFSVTYTYAETISSTEILSGRYEIEGAEIRLYPAVGSYGAPVVASLSGDLLIFAGNSYIWPLAANRETYARSSAGPGIIGP
jgi:hypothetical protein